MGFFLLLLSPLVFGFYKGLGGVPLVLDVISFISKPIRNSNKRLGLEMKEKTHASSPSTSGKTHEKTSVIQTRRLQFDVFLVWITLVFSWVLWRRSSFPSIKVNTKSDGKRENICLILYLLLLRKGLSGRHLRLCSSLHSHHKIAISWPIFERDCAWAN